MLSRIGRLVEQKPWVVIGIVILITVGFAGLLPSLDMQTSMDQFLPDDTVVNANERISDYFGADSQMMMIYVETEGGQSVVEPKMLREMYGVSQSLLTVEGADGVISFVGFLDPICAMEYGDSLVNCTDDQIRSAYYDLMTEHQISVKQSMMTTPDPNEETDVDPYLRLLKGKSVDSLDIKNYYIEENEGELCFFIEVQDLSQLSSEIMPPVPQMNVMEWYITFRNLIIPDENLDMQYTIAAHVEPVSSFWDIGSGLRANLRHVFNAIRNHELFGAYKTEVYLWITPPGEEMAFPIVLTAANVTFNTQTDQIEIRVPREELGQYGLAPEFEGFGLPARIGHTQAGFRYYQVPYLKLPWLRYTLNVSFLQQCYERLETRQIIRGLSERLLDRFTDFSWEDIGDLFAMLGESGFAMERLSLKDISGWWVVADEAPDAASSDITFFIKPTFMEEMRTSAEIFLSGDYTGETGAKATLMMVEINGSLSLEETSDVSKLLVQQVQKEDQQLSDISMQATGSSIIEYEINDVSMEANNVVVPFIFVAISLILFVSFRKISYVILPLVGLTISIIWLFGTMVLLGMSFMIMEVALIPMLMGLGVDYSVHLFHNYRSELAKGKSPGRAVAASVQDVGLAMFLATITTFIAFLSFLTVSMIPLRDFGVLCAIGIAYTFIVTITLQAAVRYILDRKKHALGRMKQKKKTDGAMMRSLARHICRHPLIMLGITLLATLIFLTGALQVQTGFRMEDFLPEENPSVKVMNDVMDAFPFSSQEKEYILLEGDIASVQMLEGIDQTMQNSEDDSYVLFTPDGEPKVTSVISLVTKAAEQNASLVEQFNLDSKGIPRTDNDVERLFDYLYDNPSYAYELEGMLHRDGDRYDATVITVYVNTMGAETDDINDVMKVLYEDLKDDSTVDYGQATAVVTGENSMMHVIMQSMTESQVLSTAICIVLAAIVLIVAYRKPLLGLLTMIPVSVSTIWIIGTMYFIGYSLNVMTIMITSLTIGLGITYAIHAVERFRLTADRTGDVVTAVSETIGHTGAALFIAAMTTIVGFGLLLLTPMPVEQQFGLITALTILYAFLTSIFILPPALMFWGKWRKKTKGYIISPGKPKNDLEES
jgi:hydrophobe/amphiphile efflux-3 (HAE3) family protein